MIWDALQEYMDSKDGGFMSVQYMKEMLMEMPQRGIADFADVPKGGGFEYSGPITIIEHFPQYAAKVVELAAKYDVLYASSARLISGGHCMMFSISFAFNRNDPAMMTTGEACPRRGDGLCPGDGRHSLETQFHGTEDDHGEDGQKRPQAPADDQENPGSPRHHESRKLGGELMAYARYDRTCRDRPPVFPVRIL